jgi:hypothetical protein
LQSLRIYVLAFIIAPAIALGVAHNGTAGSARATVQVDAGFVKAIRHYRATTRRLQLVMGHPVHRFRPLKHASLRRARTIWWRRAVAARRRFRDGPAHRGAWLCIHRYEGSWRDDGAPYYGGLQMDIDFQQLYGGRLLRTKGTADHWTPLEQMWIAERAYRSGRGFYAWPNTARFCGLI